MFCDDIIEGLAATTQAAIKEDRLAGQMAKDLVEVTSSISKAVSLSQRFVLSPLSKETVDDLADPKILDASRDYLFLPAERTWLEWRDDQVIMPGARRMGVLLEAAHCFRPELPESIVAGRAVLFLPGDPNSPVPFRMAIGLFDFPAEGAALRFKDVTAAGIDEKIAGAWVCAALALINTPRIANVVDHDHSKLNKQRTKRGKIPLLSWGEVRIRIDTGEMGQGEKQSETERRAFHHVRSHLRIRRGHVELVRPHWRGDPERGVRLHRHVVERAEDEAGPWKGGPLPAPRIIRELMTDEVDENQDLPETRVPFKP